MDVSKLAYSPAEVAQALGGSRAWVYLRINDGTIPSVRLGGRRLIRRADLEALLAGGLAGDDSNQKFEPCADRTPEADQSTLPPEAAEHRNIAPDALKSARARRARAVRGGEPDEA